MEMVTIQALLEGRARPRAGRGLVTVVTLEGQSESIFSNIKYGLINNIDIIDEFKI